MAASATTQAELFDRLTSWENLVAAARKTRRGKRRFADCARFELDRERELLRLQAELRDQRYEPGSYRTFYVREPKRRMISAASYRDRVVHHALVNVTGPLFDRNFIRDSYANQVNKGTHRAVDRYQQFARRYRYVLQCDIVKFFPSVDHEILKRLLRSRIRDEGVLWLCDLIIDGSNAQQPVINYFASDDLFTPHTRRRGLPIGNMTSQFWANVYLHGLDNFVKRGLRIGGYVRYVDDFILFADEKQTLWRARAEIIRYLERLRLRIHEERAQVRPVERPTRFLGYRCWPTHRFLSKDGIRRFRRRGRALQRQYAAGGMSWDEIRPRLAAWNAHAATADGWALRRRMLNELVFTRRGPVAVIASGAAVTGTTIHRTAARPTATGTRRRTATTTSGFGVRPGVFDRSRAGMAATTVAGSVPEESEPDSGSSDAVRRETNVCFTPVGSCRHGPGRGLESTMVARMGNCDQTARPGIRADAAKRRHLRCSVG